MSKYYFRIEAVNLFNSVYDTNDISTIRGGSFLLHDAFKDIENRIERYRLPLIGFADLGSTASVGMFSFESGLDDKDLEDQVIAPIVKEIDEKVSAFGTFVWAVRPVQESEDFVVALQLLTAACHWRQYQQLTVVLPAERNSTNYCSLDGVRPASDTVKKGEKNQPASSAVKTRRKEGRRLRNSIYKELLGGAAPQIGDDPEAWIVTNDLEALSRIDDRGQLDGKIAFIYLDGNRFSRIRNELCQSPAIYVAFQKKVQKELREPALRELLSFALQPENGTFRVKTERTGNEQGKIRLETLLWGGDEIEWVVPAWQALNVLEVFYKSCQQEDADQFEGTTLTHCAGVVFCRHDLPILKIRDYAHQLCNIAKSGITRSIREIKRIDNRIAFLNIVSFDYLTGSLDRFYENYYQPATASDFVLQAQEVDLLKSHLPIIGRLLPTSKLHALLSALQEEQRIFERVWKRTLEVLPAWQTEQLTEAVHKLGLIERPARWFLVADLLHNLAIE